MTLKIIVIIKKTIAINTNRNITIIIIITERITVITAILPIILITSNTNIYK